MIPYQKQLIYFPLLTSGGWFSITIQLLYTWIQSINSSGLRLDLWPIKRILIIELLLAEVMDHLFIISIIWI